MEVLDHLKGRESMPAMKKYPPELKERAILLATSRVAAAVRAAVLGSSSVSTSVLYVAGSSVRGR